MTQIFHDPTWRRTAPRMRIDETPRADECAVARGLARRAVRLPRILPPEHTRRHFSTSVNANPLFAEVILALLRREGLTKSSTSERAPASCSPHSISSTRPWSSTASISPTGRPLSIPRSAGPRRCPTGSSGLLIANEWLDNIPCDVVELDASGTVRLVMVDPATGIESLGTALQLDVARRLVAAELAWAPGRDR